MGSKHQLDYSSVFELTDLAVYKPYIALPRLINQIDRIEQTVSSSVMGASFFGRLPAPVECRGRPDRPFP
jgi:hypothetical protein